MKEIYRNSYLTISFESEKNRFVQNWIQSPETVSLFKETLLDFIALNAEYKPKQVLVLQQNFKLQLDLDTQFWIEENITKKGKSYGNEKLAFVLGKDILVDLIILDGFAEANSSLKPKHFASEIEALNWLETDITNEKEKKEIEVAYDGVDEEGQFVIKVKGDPRDIEKAMRLFKSLDTETKFFKSNIYKFNALTKREKEILNLYAKGMTTRQISEQLFVSMHTAQTHWRNIKNKLDIHSFFETVRYAASFNLNT